MNDTLNAVRDHYRATGLTDRLKAVLAKLGPEDQLIRPEQLAPLDQFHTRGVLATVELAELTGIDVGTAVLDVGSGVGGPARFLAATYGCRVTGIDLSEPFVEAARYLTMRTGQTEKVDFELGSALEMPFEDARFDTVLLQHVAMNIADRATLYGEIRRVLKAGGKLATFDVVLRDGDPHYPVPWAKTPATSFLLSEAETRTMIEGAGFRPLVVRDDTELAKSWAAELRGSAPPSLNLGVVMGSDFPALTGNLARNLLEGRLGIFTGVFEAIREGGHE